MTDLGQIVLLLVGVLSAGFALPFLMAWLEPPRVDASRGPGRSRPADAPSPTSRQP